MSYEISLTIPEQFASMVVLDCAGGPPQSECIIRNKRKTGPGKIEFSVGLSTHLQRSRRLQNNSKIPEGDFSLQVGASAGELTTKILIPIQGH